MITYTQQIHGELLSKSEVSKKKKYYFSINFKMGVVTKNHLQYIKCDEKEMKRQIAILGILTRNMKSTQMICLEGPKMM